MTSPELNSILANIINGGTIIFCGAGISRDSGLPIVNQIVPSILSKFNLELQEIESILDKSNNPKLPFELFIEILQENSDINDLLSIYEEGEPNLNHLIVANLIKEGKIKTILTTNFDTLLEKALCSKPNCMKQGIDFEVIYDSSQFQEIDWTENKIRIVKLHGSVEDKKNMAITIKQIASHKNLEHITSVIDFAFSKGSHKNILFLGYSASDIFDISPIIESLISNNEIYFIQHSEQFRIDNINFQNEKN